MYEAGGFVSALVRVFVVEEDQRVRRTMCELLEADPDLTIVGVAASAADALERIPHAAADVAVLPMRLPDGSGLELCRALLTGAPGLGCLMLAEYYSDESILEAMLVGASGYLVKDLKSTELPKMINDIAAGESLLDNRGMVALMKRRAAQVRQATRPAYRYRRTGGSDLG